MPIKFSEQWDKNAINTIRILLKSNDPDVIDTAGHLREPYFSLALVSVLASRPATHLALLSVLLRKTKEQPQTALYPQEILELLKVELGDETVFHKNINRLTEILHLLVDLRVLEETKVEDRLHRFIDGYRFVEFPLTLTNASIPNKIEGKTKFKPSLEAQLKDSFLHVSTVLGDDGKPSNFDLKIVIDLVVRCFPPETFDFLKILRIVEQVADRLTPKISKPALLRIVFEEIKTVEPNAALLFAELNKLVYLTRKEVRYPITKESLEWIPWMLLGENYKISYASDKIRKDLAMNLFDNIILTAKNRSLSDEVINISDTWLLRKIVTVLRATSGVDITKVQNNLLRYLELTRDLLNEEEVRIDGTTELSAFIPQIERASSSLISYILLSCGILPPCMPEQIGADVHTMTFDNIGFFESLLKGSLIKSSPPTEGISHLEPEILQTSPEKSFATMDYDAHANLTNFFEKIESIDKGLKLCDTLRLVVISAKSQKPQNHSDVEELVRHLKVIVTKLQPTIPPNGLQKESKDTISHEEPSNAGLDSYCERIVKDYEKWGEWHMPDGTVASQPIIDAMKKRDLYHAFVPLDAFKRKDPFKNVSLYGSESYLEPEKGNKAIIDYSPIDNFFKEWLQDPLRSHVTILADFGSGKTSTLINLCYELAKRYLNSNDTSIRAPIFIPLQHFPQKSSFSDYIMDILQNRYGIMFSWKTFQDLLSRGKFVLLLDGFDEMAVRGDEGEAIRNFLQIDSLIMGLGKSVLTSRGHYFRTNKEALKTLLAVNPDDPLSSVSGRSRFEVLELRSLDYSKIRRITTLRYPKKALKLLKQIESIGDGNLLDLAHRPILLHMILDSFDRLRILKEVDLTLLYDSYTSQWVDVDTSREIGIMSPDGKRRLMQILAWKIFTHAKNTAHGSVHFSELSDHVNEFFSSEIRLNPTKHDLFQLETRTCTFLNRDEIGNYGFMEQSFMDYFLAKYFVEELKTTNKILISWKQINPLVRAFLEGTVSRDLLAQEILESIVKAWTDPEDITEWLFWRDLTNSARLDDYFALEDNQLRAIRERVAGQGPIIPPNMVCIPEGWFIRGSWEYEPSGLDYTYMRPARRIWLNNFAIDKFLVTNEQFSRFVKETGYKTTAEKEGWGMVVSSNDRWEKKENACWTDPSGLGIGVEDKGNHPVVQVSYDDALEYCKWRSKVEGVSFTLPTEAQYEKAARGALGRRFPWGNKWKKEMANCSSWWAKRELSREDWAKWWRNVKKRPCTTPVGQFPPNMYGIFDIVGNVWEWCRDYYSPGFYVVSSDRNPINEDGHEYRVIRGGGWDDLPTALRCAWRYTPKFYERGDNLGFRSVYNFE